MVIGLIGAMDEEISAIKAGMEDICVVRKAGMEFYTGKLKNKNIVAVRSGIGKVNAAICTQLLIDVFNVDTVINTGIAGGVNEEVNPGDIVISTDLVHHDMDASSFGNKLGQVPRMEVFAFKADNELADIAVKSAEDLNKYNVFKGRIISGDQFIAESYKIDYLRKKFEAYAVEMEGAAIGHTCYVNKIPFVVIRSISDKADEKVNEDYWEFKNIAINNSVKIITRMIENM